MNKITIGLAGDQAGFEYKEAFIQILEKEKDKYITRDFGSRSKNSVDYPDYVHPLCNALLDKKIDLGVLICGSGNGVAITANKHNGIRAALCWSEEIASLARRHNNANILCIPARFTDPELAENILRIFLNSEFEGGRHKRRIDKIDC